ncbi:MAG: hypothetical protein JWN98_1650, partial [Abditibacteriota bacterium]|nr:hypothetical protein [Abditibacteriota bacterium]
AVGVAKSIGLGVLGFSEALDRLKPDILVLPGDRFEILAAAQAALVAKIPIAHLFGGDTSEGAFDEAIRHSITKMSHLHFVTNEVAAQRVRQLGENPEHIYNVGSPGLDFLSRIKLLERVEFEASLDFKLRERNYLVTFHPVTLDSQPAEEQFREVLAALDALGPDVGLIITKPNADNEGRTLIRMIDDFVAQKPNAVAHMSLGQLRYLSAISHVDAVIGNSSSGLYEVPSFGKPTINIGDRQKGRLQAASVINCAAERNDVLRAIQEAHTKDCSGVTNPYGDGNSAARIVNVLATIEQPESLIKKHFFNL